MSFAALEARVNAATLAAFSNRDSVTVNGVLLTRAVFDANFVDVLGIDSSGPAVSCLTSECDAAGVVYGGPVIVNGTDAYKVTKPEPDGTGLTVLRLHKA